MKIIGIPLLPKPPGLLRMLDTIGKAFDVQFKQHSMEDKTKVDAWFIYEADQKVLNRLSCIKRPIFATIREDQLRSCGGSNTIEFSRSDDLPSVLRGRQIWTNEAVGLKSLPQWLHNISVLASKEKAPVWAIHEHGDFQHHYVSISIPELNEGEPLFQYFHGKQFLCLLPVFHFLRSLFDDEGWEQPPLQACFMFDDPNLHWPKYGFIDYAKMARHAGLNNYHVAFATIPLDAWFIHQPTGRLFCEHKERLSLLIHGNDHVTGELAKRYRNEEYYRILGQALRRIAHLERRSGVKVARVLAPPHGACNESFLGAMDGLQFEAACISRGSLRRHNSQAKWVSTLGMEPADIINGLPVFSRFPLSKNSYNNILVAALLGQPIIPMGHHQDVSDGLQILSEVSQFINSLGKVNWSDMAHISRSHFARKIEGDTLWIKMFTKRVEIQIPKGIYGLRIKRSWMKRETSEPFEWRTVDGAIEWNSQKAEHTMVVVPGQRIEIASATVGSIDCDTKSLKRPKIWPVIRRFLTEARDRIAPTLQRILMPESFRSTKN